MKRLTAKSAIFLALSVVGIGFAAYSIKAKNYILLVVALLFGFISMYNIFCNLRRK